MANEGGEYVQHLVGGCTMYCTCGSCWVSMCLMVEGGGWLMGMVDELGWRGVRGGRLWGGGGGRG